MKNWNDYLDSKGFVTIKESLGGDAGDSLNRTCAAYILSQLTGGIGPSLPSLDPLINSDNKWRRSWQEPKWYAYWDRASRDQLTPLVITLGLFGNKALLWRTFKDHCKRLLLFTTNVRDNFMYPTLTLQQQYGTPDVVWDYTWKVPDLTGPEFWALYVRGLNSILLYPLLWVFDIQTFIGSTILRFQTENDVINQAFILEYAKVRMDTVWMKLARLITSRKVLQPRMDSFFGPDTEPPLNDLYRELK